MRTNAQLTSIQALSPVLMGEGVLDFATDSKCWTRFSRDERLSSAHTEGVNVAHTKQTHKRAERKCDFIGAEAIKTYPMRHSLIQSRRGNFVQAGPHGHQAEGLLCEEELICGIYIGLPGQRFFKPLSGCVADCLKSKTLLDNALD